MADDDRKDKLDRELIELLNELRVALPGVQVLFAFLLTVPFTQRFESLSGFQRDAYFGAFLATAVSSAFLMAPSAYHRLRWRQYDKERMLVTSNRLAIAGIALLALAIGGVVLVVTDIIFPRAAAATTASVGVLLAWTWFGLPLSRRLADRRRGAEELSRPAVHDRHPERGEISSSDAAERRARAR